MIPVIETARLRLRGHRSSDLAACAAMWSDPEVVKHISGRPSTEQQTWARVLAYGGHWAFMGFGYWVIEEKNSNEFVGEAGFADFKRDVASLMKNRPELGFALTPRFHGKGYATEAVRGALEWADKNLKAPRTVAMVDPSNVTSLRVLEKCGYAIVERGVYNEQPTLFLSRDVAL